MMTMSDNILFPESALLRAYEIFTLLTFKYRNGEYDNPEIERLLNRAEIEFCALVEQKVEKILERKRFTEKYYK
jgi:hypothetical protein